MSDRNEFLELLGSKREPMHLCLENTKEIMCRGLRYFVGDDAKWLQGYDDISEWLHDNQGKGLLLYGANGRGKSVMCFCIIPTIIAFYYKNIKQYKCRASNLRALHPDNSEYYSMFCADAWFIDDFGTETLTSVYGEKRDVFSDVVDIAEQDKKLLVLSTNLTPKEIQQRYGLRTLDRLQSITRAICLSGDSMRNK